MLYLKMIVYLCTRKIAKNENIMNKQYPKIGIRPTIDGRRGKIKVRESLEDQTMNMAKPEWNDIVFP